MQNHRQINIAEAIEVLKQENLFVECNVSDLFISLGRPQTDSRKVKLGETFICIYGMEADGHDYIPKALENGASLLVTEKKVTTNYIQVTNTRKATAILAKLFYHDPSSEFSLIGITGTKW